MKRSFLATFLLSALLLSACQAPAPIPENDAATELVQAQLLVAFADIENQWAAAVMRGDAEGAPTYAEFMVAMYKVSQNLEELVLNNEVPAEISDISRRLIISQMRGDAELAPTYAEAITESAGLLQEYRAALKAEGVVY